MRYRVLVFFVLIVALGLTPTQAGTFQDIYRGLELLATPSGFPIFSSGDGTRYNGARSGRLRIVPSGIGSGYQLEFDRTFGNDSRGRPETLHLAGLADLILSGSAQMTLGYNGKEFRSISGSASVNSLNYILRSKTGFQDVELSGSLGLSQAFEVNPLGFYELVFNLSNTNSTLFVDGVLARDTEDINFDLGPIVVGGNIFFDASLAVLTGLGVDTSELEEIFPRSPIDQINDAIEAQLQEMRAIAGNTLESDLALSLTQAVLQGDAEAADHLLAEVASEPFDAAGDASDRGQPNLVPEPGTLLLVALGGSTLWYWRRRQ